MRLVDELRWLNTIVLGSMPGPPGASPDEHVCAVRLAAATTLESATDLLAMPSSSPAALEAALTRRCPEIGLLHHSDQGCQYPSIAFGNRCREAGVRPSMGSVGDCYDNAMCESFNAILECELLVNHRFANQREAAFAVFEFINGWYNPHRRHTALGMLSPAEFERRNQAA